MPSPTSELTSSLEAELVAGFAAALDGWDIATYNPAGYEAGDVRPVYFGPDEPANAPDERILLTVRPSLPVRGRIVQTPIGINWRGEQDGDPLDGANVLGLLYRRLDRLSHHTFGTVRVGAVLFSSAGSIGRDARRRPGATATYMFRGLSASVNG